MVGANSSHRPRPPPDATSAVARVAGFAVAARFAGHTSGSVTGTYTQADISEVAAAVALLTGEPHPLAA